MKLLKLLALVVVVTASPAFAQDVTTVIHFDDWSITSYSKHDYHFLHTKTSEYQYNRVQLTCGGDIQFETEDEVTLGRGFSIDGTDIYAFGHIETSAHMSGEEDDAIIAQLKAGRTLTLHELTFYGYGTNDYSLIGFTAAYDKFMWTCDASEDDAEHTRLQCISDTIQEELKTMSPEQIAQFHSSQERMTPEEIEEFEEDFAAAANGGADLPQDQMPGC